LTKISLYLDEHVQLALAESLRTRGVDVLTTQEAGNICLSDVDQLIFAKENKRILFSYNKRHFAKIHYEWMTGKPYSGKLNVRFDEGELAIGHSYYASSLLYP